MGLKQNMWAQRDHRASRDDLSAYLDGELESRRAKRLERHLQVCTTCQQELATLRETKLLLRCLPQQPLPRSFVLPLAVAVERRRYHLWNTGFVALRGVAAALSLTLVILISGNVLLARGVLTVPGRGGQAPEAAPMLSAEQPVAPELAAAALDAPEALPTPTVAAALVPTAAQADSALVSRAMAAVQPTTDAADAAWSDAGTPAEEAQPETAEPAQAKASPIDQQGPLTALVTDPRPVMPAAEADEDIAAAAAGGGLGGSEAQPPTDAAAGLAPAEPNAITPTPEALAAPTPTSAPSPTATAQPEPTVAEPLPVPTVDGAVVALAAPEPTATLLAVARQAEPMYGRGATPAMPVATADTWQQGISAATGVLLGALLMVIGGLVWTGYMRRR